MSFGYKYGVPRDADLVLDVRFLPNPHWVPRLRPLPGTDARVRRYVTEQEAYGEFMKRLIDLLDFVVPGYVAEGKSYLTIGVGCTGGRHRSVVVSEALARVLPGPGPARWPSTTATWGGPDDRVARRAGGADGPDARVR